MVAVVTVTVTAEGRGWVLGAGADCTHCVMTLSATHPARPAASSQGEQELRRAPPAPRRWHPAQLAPLHGSIQAITIHIHISFSTTITRHQHPHTPHSLHTASSLFPTLPPYPHLLLLMPPVDDQPNAPLDNGTERPAHRGMSAAQATLTPEPVSLKRGREGSVVSRALLVSAPARQRCTLPSNTPRTPPPANPASRRTSPPRRTGSRMRPNPTPKQTRRSPRARRAARSARCAARCRR